MDDFHPIPFAEASRPVLAAGHDLFVDLDGDTPSGQAKGFNEFGNRVGLGFQDQGFTIELDLHGILSLFTGIAGCIL
jgi:hypothetical protein